MAENEAVIIRNPDNESISPNPNPFSSIISKFTQLFNFRFPPPPPPAKRDVSKIETVNKTDGEAVSSGVEVTKTVTVKFPVASTATVDPVKLESEVIEQNSNPVIVWQVYAIGGFFILKWMVGRWKELRANKKSSGKDSPPLPPPPPPPPPPAEADE